MNKQQPEPLLYLPVETSRGIEYAVVPTGMSNECFDFMLKCLDFYAAHLPGFVVSKEEAPEQPTSPSDE